MRKLAIITAFLLLAGSSFAMLGGLTSGVSGFCSGLMNILPVASMLMVIVGAVVYASGQIMGAETRARANVWAATCITGALFGILIVTVGPPVLTAIGGNAVSCSGGSSGCSATCCGPSQCTNPALPVCCHPGCGNAACIANSATCMGICS